MTKAFSTSQLNNLTSWGIIVTLTLFLSCNNNVQKKTEAIQNVKIENEWPENGKSKDFKIDTSEFMIRASLGHLQFKLEPNESFESQLFKINIAMTQIEKEMDLGNLKSLRMDWRFNNDLLQDIAAVPEIQEELQLKRKNGIVNSMGIVSEYAYKSKKLKEFTDIYLKYKLEPDAYYIEKCRPDIINEDTTILSLFCGGYFIIQLKEIR